MPRTLPSFLWSLFCCDVRFVLVIERDGSLYCSTPVLATRMGLGEVSLCFNVDGGFLCRFGCFLAQNDIRSAELAVRKPIIMRCMASEMRSFQEPHSLVTEFTYTVHHFIRIPLYYPISSSHDMSDRDCSFKPYICTLLPRIICTQTPGS